MASTLILMAIVIFLGGIAAGVVLVVSLASNQEDRDHSMKGAAPTVLTQGARVVTGLYVRDIVNAGSAPAERETTLA